MATYVCISIMLQNLYMSDPSGIQVTASGHTSASWRLSTHWDARLWLLQVNNLTLKCKENSSDLCSVLTEVIFFTVGCWGTTARTTRGRMWSAMSCWLSTWGSSPQRSSSSTAGNSQVNCGNLHAIRCCRKIITLKLRDKGFNPLFHQESERKAEPTYLPHSFLLFFFVFGILCLKFSK